MLRQCWYFGDVVGEDESNDVCCSVLVYCTDLFFSYFQENLSFSMLRSSTSDVNTVALVLRMILACVTCGQNAFGIRGLLCTFTWSKNPGKNLSILVIGSNGTCIGCSHVKLPKFNSIRGFKILTERRKGVALL